MSVVKTKMREKHPEPVMTPNKTGEEVKKYSDGHIHKMAIWRTLTKFTEWLYREWTRIEGGGNGHQKV